MSEPLIVIGNGMAAARLTEELARRALGRYAVAVIGEEPQLAYNRVLLSALLARDVAVAACRAGRVVVIGGGLLGLEAAYGLAKARERAASVTVVHLMDRLMERQLDPAAALMLACAVASKGIAVRLEAETARIVGKN